ncbi:valine--tRNA ligase [Candidatus Kaiserbacteria bacterium RIFCSPHIGHO2_02_FULL_54_11b]|uniref:Valine--tRNA ligase n=2 Tax=Candidatus Kaiseribacteriota TaxID=1752734 RepID=A0A1F6CR81_9BACT|nr:MAG: valine--tRNA ligase [Candidatus Kaiserbacteria bacterium RIFCSPHIGHO2_01_FULL_54_36b]OGG63987.1 MAG: valine--tRNA ligase [Candidatus Kaiserbacteria bacterium RIFCSPHIGHO2_02_FULL_54_11b]
MEPSKVPEPFLKPYNPAQQEPKMLALWEKSGYANPDVCIEKGITKADAEPYSIVLPPPNVTGTLHMGHAAMLAIEDILIRYHRMRGYKTLWLPGTDSAAIATQSKVETDIYKAEKKTRHDLGREELMKRIDAFVEESKATIINQTKKMGSSLDWSRYAYTMDDKRYAAVMEAFVRMYDAGLIYRGDRIVNWDPKLQTTVSDDEIEYVEQKDAFYHFKYGPFDIGTVRPETKFGDKYVVMHPDDARYKEYTHGQTIELEWINGPITATIIKDAAADMAFGSGAMTITPAHSGIDFEIASRHKLDIERVIDDRGILLDIAGEFKGQHIKKARPLIVEKLRAKGLIAKVDEGYVHNVATNSRGGGIIEPQIKRQWFIDVNKEVKFPDGTTSLKQKMREAVSSGDTKIMPERFEKIYYHWIDNLRDWCISRQIWFGHRIPAWFKGDEVKVSIESPGDGWVQDEDTLDTWFSSGLWTFSTLGWPEETADLKTYHPTTVLETGYDILFFWVARMILMSTFLRGEVPFKNVYLHGLVRDGQGRKMSKSLGNIIDPLTMIEKYGADAARLSLIIGASMGNDVKLSEDRVRGYKHFANKLWNITRFVLENTEGLTLDDGFDDRNEFDSALREERRATFEEVTKHIDTFRLDLAADKLYHYIWDRFADEIIEDSKRVFKDGSEDEKKRRRMFLLYTLDWILKGLHPFMPFVTEAIWQQLPKKESDLLMVAKWPV